MIQIFTNVGDGLYKVLEYQSDQIKARDLYMITVYVMYGMSKQSPSCTVSSKYRAVESAQDKG
jgi:hypothetical protein